MGGSQNSTFPALLTLQSTSFWSYYSERTLSVLSGSWLALCVKSKIESVLKMLRTLSSASRLGLAVSKACREKCYT